MKTNAQVLDMRPDGSFVQPATPSLARIAVRLAGFGVLLLVAAALFKATVLLWPVLLVLAVISVLTLRAQLRHRRVVVVQRGRF